MQPMFLNGAFFLLKRISILPVCVCLFLPFWCVAQNDSVVVTEPPRLKLPVEASFLTNNIELNKTGIASDILKVVNNNGKLIRFTILINYPAGWKCLSGENRVYDLKQGDSLFIPIRIIPSKPLKGNTKYIINAHLVSEEGLQLADAFFFTSTKKETHWEMTIAPRERIYFLNNEKTASFNVNLFNSGNEEQDILTTFVHTGNNVILSDTNDKLIRYKYLDLRIPSTHDTTLYYKASYYEGARNYKKIDLENYVPGSSSDERKFTLYVRSQEPKMGAKNVFSANKKVDFIRLGNEKKVNPWGSAALPLTAEANIHNVLGNQPIMNLYMRGNTYLNNGANLIYFSQINYTTYQFNQNLFDKASFFLGYMHKKGDVQIGNINGGGAVGVPLYGKGIRGRYILNAKHQAGAFLVRGPGIFTAPGVTSFGADHRYVISRDLVLSSQYGHMINSKSKINTDYLGLNSSCRISAQHRIGLGLTGTRSHYYSDPADIFNLFGGSVNLSYGGIYLQNLLRTNANLFHAVNDLGTGSSRRTRFLNRSSYLLNPKWTIILHNNLDHYKVLRTGSYNTTLFNQLFFSRNVPSGRIMPGVYYNTSNIYAFRMHARGVSFDYNYFDMGKSLRFGSSLKGGYHNIIDDNTFKDFFVFQLFSMLQYRNISLNGRYNYGTQSLMEEVKDILKRSRYPQAVFLSFQHQYMFPGNRFVLQTSTNYSHYNQLYSHSFGLFPELYYFTRNGWRFKLNAGYTITSSNTRRAALYSRNPFPNSGEEFTPLVNQGFQAGMGIKKDFGIPIPKRFTKQRFSNVEITAFLDVNGNRKKDKGEPGVENMVIRIGDDEVITNEKGTAKLLNLKDSTYRQVVFPINDLQGWFPMMEDSVSIINTKEIFVPFVKGVKLHGDIAVSRDPMSGDKDAMIDLSRIHINAIDSSGKIYTTLTGADGTFVFYVPNGNYVLSMDETLIGDVFFLAKNNFDINITEGIESLYSSFYIIEKPRRIVKKRFSDHGTEKQDSSKTAPSTFDTNNDKMIAPGEIYNSISQTLIQKDRSGIGVDLISQLVGFFSVQTNGWKQRPLPADLGIFDTDKNKQISPQEFFTAVRNTIENATYTNDQVLKLADFLFKSPEANSVPER